MKFAVFQSYQDPAKHKPTTHVKKAVGVFLIAAGKAIKLSKNQIQLMPQDTRRELRCGQADTYEIIAIDKHPRMFLGGLTRNEHQPRILKPFHGARVAH